MIFRQIWKYISLTLQNKLYKPKLLILIEIFLTNLRNFKIIASTKMSFFDDFKSVLKTSEKIIIKSNNKKEIFIFFFKSLILANIE